MTRFISGLLLATLFLGVTSSADASSEPNCARLMSESDVTPPMVVEVDAPVHGYGNPLWCERADDPRCMPATPISAWSHSVQVAPCAPSLPALPSTLYRITRFETTTQMPRNGVRQRVDRPPC